MYVRKGKGNTYYLECSAGFDVTGKRKKYYRTVHANGKRELNAEIRRFETDIESGLAKKKTKLSVVDLCEKGYSTLSLNAKETTLKGYRVIIDRLKMFPFGNAKADLVETYDVQEFVKTLSETEYKEGKTYSPKTIRHTISFLSTCFDLGIQASLVTHNPCQGVRLPKKEKSTARALNLDELPVFLMNLESVQLDLRVAYELALFLGLRRSEICGLKEEHIYEDYIDVNQTRHWVDGKELVQSTKTSGSEAYIALPKFLQEDIKALIEYHRSEEERIPDLYKKSDYLILAPDGSPIYPGRMNDSLQRYIKKCGISHVTFHQLRHTYASLVNHFGADIVELASQMRHANATTTLSIYTHMVTSVSASSRKYASKMDEYFSDTFSDTFDSE